MAMQGRFLRQQLTGCAISLRFEARLRGDIDVGRAPPHGVWIKVPKKKKKTKYELLLIDNEK